MKVYYSAGIGEKCKGKIGKKQVLNWRFKHLGKERIIPCLYRFKEGIVFDVLTLLDEEEILGFINKYENCDEDMMSINQQREIEQEHPYQELSLARIEINGQHCNSGYSSTGSLYMPFFNKDKKLKLLQKEYKKSLGNHTTFASQRFCVPYGEDKTPRQRLKQREGSYRINTLRIITHEEQRFYPIEEQIELSKLVSKGEIKFNHPMTQVAYKLSIQLDEEMVLPEELGYGEALYAASATYETQPELTEHEQLDFEATLKYERQIGRAHV